MARTNAEKFLMFADRARDMVKGQNEDIVRNIPQRISMGVMAEYEWLVNAVKQLTNNDPAKLNKLDLTLLGEPAEQAAATKAA